MGAAVRGSAPSQPHAPIAGEPRSRQAAEHGRAVESYAAGLLERAAYLPATPAAPPAKDMVELLAPLRGLNLNFERDGDTGRDIKL
jgi:hypothetical protein